MAKRDVLKDLSPSEKIVYQTLKEKGELDITNIIANTLLSTASVRTALSKLMIRGLVAKRRETRYVLYFIKRKKD